MNSPGGQCRLRWGGGVGTAQSESNERLITREFNGIRGKGGIDATLVEELICCDQSRPNRRPVAAGLR